MKTLFGLDDVIILNPYRDLQEFLSNENYQADIRARIKSYCDSCFLEHYDYQNRDIQFFILSQTNTITLNHRPKPQRNNANKAYYTLSEILDENNKILSSKKDDETETH